MITPVVQRWRDRRDSYRPAGETIDPSRFDVVPIDDDTTAKGFVERHHYSGSYPAARFRFGLYELGELVGVAVFSQPVNNATLSCLGCGPVDGVELGRLVLLDGVRANGESWFIARCFDRLRRDGLAGVVSFSDPTRRHDAAGRVVFAGHVGTIYQASSAVYLGRSAPSPLRLFADGSVLHKRAMSKLRKRDKGWRYVAERLQRFGADTLDDTSDAGVWLDTWLPRLTCVVRHQGNHKYAFGLARSVRRHLPKSEPYPKLSLFGEAS